MASNESSTNFGFERPEMFSLPVPNSVEFYQRHLFLCHKNPQLWPSLVETSDFPKLFSSVLKARQPDIPLKESNVDTFVDDVLVNGKTWTGGEHEALVGTYVFVCAHASRDKRCGHCGPILIDKFTEEIGVRGLKEIVFVNVSSHVGGHKYAGNVIIFGRKSDGKVTGDWYGYVTPKDVPDLLEAHVSKGEIVEKLWRGQMGLKSEATKKEENKPSTENIQEKTEVTSGDTGNKLEGTATGGCCQGTGAASCGLNQEK